MIKELQRKDYIEQLKAHGYTYNELRSMSYRELLTELSLIDLTDEEVKKRRDWF